MAKARFDRHGPDGEVVDLSETNFDEVVGRGTPVLVKVYAEWCKHCVALAPVWGEVARELEGELFVGRVDGPKNRLLLKRIGAKAYPTIALFKNGKMYEYESGDRSVAAIVSFARKDYRKTKARGFFHAVWFSKGLRLLYAVPAIGEKAYAYLHRRFETEQRGHLVLDAVRARDGGDVCDIRRRHDDLSRRASRDARDVPKR